MKINRASEPVKVIVVFSDGEIAVFDKENIEAAESVIRDADMAQEMLA